jgi:hypothetical protein
MAYQTQNGTTHIRDISDFTISRSGYHWLLEPLTDAAKEWTDEHIPEEANWIGGRIFIECNYGPPIFDGILEAGLTLEGVS